MRIAFLHRIACVVLLVGFVAGCRSSGGPPANQITITGGADLNSGGNAAAVRVYELSNDTNFRNVSIESFWQDDAAALGDELISTNNILLYPGQTELISLNIGEETRFIGVAADLRNPDRDRWREVYPVADLGEQSIYVTVGDNQVALSVR